MDKIPFEEINNEINLTLETVTGSTTRYCKNIKIFVPTKGGDTIEVVGFTINKGLTEIEEQFNDELNQIWPNLDKEIQDDVQQNRIMGQIDILIGQDNIWKFVLNEAEIHPSEEFGIIKTKLGWTMGGCVYTASSKSWQRIRPKKINVCKTKTNIVDETNKEIEESLNRLFNKEEDEIKGNEYTVEEKQALDTFIKNVRREKDGRYTVSPLHKNKNLHLRNNYYHALTRYRALQKTLDRDESKRKIYSDAINQLIINGEVEEVNEHPSKSKNMDANMNYLPHHGVFKLDRLTTKCRIVFDASSKNSEGISLNDNLLAGPRKQLDIVYLLIKMRMHPTIIIGDISRMFYCINLDKRYRDHYRFLWSKKADEEPKIYRFKRLTMGTTDSPFLAINTVHHHLDQIAEEYPELKNTTEFVKDHLYVDDLLGAVDSAKEAIELRKQIQEIFAKMKMTITKWTSNSAAVLNTIPEGELSPFEEIQDEENNITFSDPAIISKTTKCLGMSWTPKEDILHYSTYAELSSDTKLKQTKRGISSVIPRIYDPTGLLQPFIIKGKLILQAAWTQTNKSGKPLGWDDPLPEEIKNKWLKWIEEIKEAAKFQVDRYIFKNSKTIPLMEEIYLHVFTDAGENAWGIAIYIRYYNEETRKYESHLIYSATRVAPNKTKLSVPKKELNGVLLGVQKAIGIAEAMKIKKENIYVHTDSLVALTWINKNKNALKTYVSNRVSKIQEANLKILYTPGTENPADLCSKPKPSKEYINNVFWTSGPSYLQLPNKEWEEKYSLKLVTNQKLSEDEETSIIKEEKPITKVKINNIKLEIKPPQGIYSLIDKYNNYTKLLNVTAQCFRAIVLMTRNMTDTKRREEITKGYKIHRLSANRENMMEPEEQAKLHLIPSIREIQFANKFLIIETQKLKYPEEYEALKANQPLPEKSTIRKLNPQLKEEALVMISRLANLHHMPEQVRNPIILPKDTKITNLIILNQHKLSAHAGPEVTLRNVRLQYWLPGGRQQVRKALKLCEHKICKYPNPKEVSQQIANLPTPRITPGNFDAISLDFAEPFTIKKCGICKHQNTCEKCLKKMKN